MKEIISAINAIDKVVRMVERVGKIVGKIKKVEPIKNERLIEALVGLGYSREKSERMARGVNPKKKMPDQIREALNNSEG